jgi:hypothetical protein
MKSESSPASAFTVVIALSADDRRDVIAMTMPTVIVFASARSANARGFHLARPWCSADAMRTAEAVPRRYIPALG